MASNKQQNNGSEGLELVSFDGEAVWGKWTGGNSANPFIFALFEDGVELQRTIVEYGPQSEGPFSARIDVGPRLDPDPARSHTVGVSRGNGPESFDSTLPVIVAAPVLVSLDYSIAGDSPRIHALSQAPSGPGETLVLTLWADGYEIGRATGSASEATLELGEPLSPWRELSVRLHHQSASSIGRMGGPIALVVDAPVITHTDYDGSAVGVGWTHPAGTRASTGGQISLHVEGSPSTSADASGDSGTIEATLDPAASVTVSVRATRGPVIGPESRPAQVIAAKRAATRTRVDHDGSTIDVTLEDAREAGVSHYELELRSGGVTVATAVAGDTGGTLAAPLDHARSYAVAVRALGDGRRGQLGDEVGVVTTTPGPVAIATASTPERTLAVTLAALPSHATSVAITLLRDGVPEGASVTGPGPELALAPTQPVVDGSAYAIELRAHAGGDPALIGPLTAPTPVVVHAPRITSARWDGAHVHVRWQAAAQAELVGYTVELHASDGSQTTDPVPTHETEVALAFATPTAGVVYTVTVRARTARCVGPMQLEPSVVSMRPRPAAWFVADGVVHRGDPRQVSASPSTDAITLLLPRLFVGSFETVSQNHSGELSEDGVQAGDGTCFGLDLSGVEGRPWKLTIRASNLPSTSAELRDKLDKLMAQLEAAPAGSPREGALALVRQVIARAAPLRYDQLLVCAYGLDVEGRSVDLVPGMRLRVDPSVWQLVPPDPSVGSALSGYVPTGSVFYELEAGSGRPGRTGASAFLSRMSSDASEARDGEVDTGLGGSVDLVQQRLRRPWLRLVYPATFVAGNERGSIGTTGQVALIAEDSYAKLVSTARDVASNSPGDHGAVTFFRGRAALIPEICVSLDGQAHWVAVGTTVRQLLARQAGAPLPPSEGETTAALAGLSLARSLGGVVELADDLADGERFDRHEPVLLDRASPGDRFELPLLHGDRLSTLAADG